MVDTRIKELENDLRSYIGRFVGNSAKWGLYPFYEAFKGMPKYERNAFLCGGAPRDILLSKGRVVPRDLDIVLQYGSLEEMSSLLCHYIRGNTRFGGLSLQIKDWTIDMWPLLETWAFKEKQIEGKGFRDFTGTTFLDIDAVAVQLFTKKGQKRKIYSKGFFEAILMKTVEINFEDNPYPAVCVLKSLFVANRYKFALGPRLARYISYHAGRLELEELSEIYSRRYQSGILSQEKLRSYIDAINEQLQVSRSQPVRLAPTGDESQFSTWLWSAAHQSKRPNKSGPKKNPPTLLHAQ